jgi:hypothetical protein
VIQGSFIGIFMGVLAGVDMLVLLNPVISMIGRDPTTELVRLVSRITTAILSLPTIMFGGSWISKNVIFQKDLPYFSECYTGWLTFVFLMIIVYPLYKWILKFGRIIGG